MIISKRPFTSEKTLLAKTSPSTPLACVFARLATAGARTSHKVRRIFGDSAQRQLKARPRPADIQHFTFRVRVNVERQPQLPTSRPSQLNTPGSVLTVRPSTLYSPRISPHQIPAVFQTTKIEATATSCRLYSTAHNLPASARRCARRCGSRQRQKYLSPLAAEKVNSSTGTGLPVCSSASSKSAYRNLRRHHRGDQTETGVIPHLAA